jgi:hypothetical protein
VKTVPTHHNSPTVVDDSRGCRYRERKCHRSVRVKIINQLVLARSLGLLAKNAADESYGAIESNRSADCVLRLMLRATSVHPVRREVLRRAISRLYKPELVSGPTHFLGFKKRHRTSVDGLGSGARDPSGRAAK